MVSYQVKLFGKLLIIQSAPSGLCILHNGVDAKFSENNQTTLNRLKLRNKRNIKAGQHLIKIGNCALSELYIPNFTSLL